MEDIIKALKEKEFLSQFLQNLVIFVELGDFEASASSLIDFFPCSNRVPNLTENGLSSGKKAENQRKFKVTQNH
jgi:hypothetical protein